LHAVSLGAKVIEKHFSNNKSLQVESQMAHGCSMDFNDLSLLRNLTDSITLINSSKKD
jgi:sialic acid synthase SpsE